MGRPCPIERISSGPTRQHPPTPQAPARTLAAASRAQATGPGRKGMLRNLCVALGNYGATSAEAAARVRPVLERAEREP